MKALYLYFAGTAEQGRTGSPAPGTRPATHATMIDEGPLVPIQPGAFSRWMANRDRVVTQNAASLRRGADGASLLNARNREATG